METTAPPRQTAEVLSHRIPSIDILRGLVMVIMALDHVREFWGPTSFQPEDLSQTSPPLFFTRWITHLCAPTFVFLSGAGIYLYQSKTGSLKKTGIFAVSRGLWLMVVEIVIVSFIVTQAYDITLLGVFWMIGLCMVLLAGLIWLPRWILVGLSIAMIAFHQLLPPIAPGSATDVLLGIFHNTPFFIPQPPVLVTYTIVPWVAVMLAGYVTGSWFQHDTTERNRRLRFLSVVLLVLFVALRLINVYGDPFPFAVQDRGWIFTAMSFINVTKYPPSLQFICLTIGIGLLLIPLFKDHRTKLNQWLITYGQVPFFFFVIHFALISLASYVWTMLAFGSGVNLAFTQADARPADYTPDLLRVYLAWVIVLVVTYFPCKWFGAYKKKNRSWWVSYF